MPLNSDIRKRESFTCIVRINGQQGVKVTFFVFKFPNEAIYARNRYAIVHIIILDYVKELDYIKAERLIGHGLEYVVLFLILYIIIIIEALMQYALTDTLTNQ